MSIFASSSSDPAILNQMDGLVENVQRKYLQAWSYLLSRPTLLVFLSAVAFICIVVGASLYADLLTWDYPTTNGLAQGLGTNQLSLIGSLVQYDAGHYVLIARDGYDLTHTAFLPLYPALIAGGTLLSGISQEAVAMIIPWVIFPCTAVMLFKLFMLEIRDRTLDISPWFVLGVVAVFPTSFYFALPYTESLFVLLLAGALYYYRTEKYLLSAAFGLFASATKYQALALCAFMAVDIVLRMYHKNPRPARAYIATAAPIVGFSLYLIYLWQAFGTPFAFIQAQQEWGRLQGNIIENLIASFVPIFIWFIAVSIVGIYGVWKYLPKPYLFFTLAVFAIPLSSGLLTSMNRYMLTAIPLFLGLALVIKRAHPVFLWAYLTSSAMLLGWGILLFTNGYWVA